MKKIFLIFLLLLSTINVESQNLIENSGFDSLRVCPTETLINNDSNGANKVVPPWFAPSHLMGTPDIFNRCSPSTELGVPVNKQLSYQQPLSGSGYAGIVTYSEFGREYISTKLSKELKKGSQYYGYFYISPLSFPKSYGYFMTYTDAIGLTFSADTIPSLKGILLITSESIGNPKGQLIKDTIGWTKISGCYKAKGGERYATIGNFRADSDVILELENSRLSDKAAYHYVEDVSVLEFNPLPDSTILILRLLHLKQAKIA